MNEQKMPKLPLWPCRHRFKFLHGNVQHSNPAAAAQQEIGLDEAIRIQSAEFWLRLGQPEAALLELKALPEGLQNHPSALKARLLAMHAKRQPFSANPS